MLCLVLAAACGGARSASSATEDAGAPAAGAGNPPAADAGPGATPDDAGTTTPPADAGTTSVSVDAGSADAGLPSLGVMVHANLDSAVLSLGAIAAARDYRAFALPPGASATVGAGGRETVTGTTIYCAGFRQHNAKATAKPEPVTAVEVTGVTAATEFVVEAIDRPCPFPGVRGATHVDIATSEPTEIEPQAQGAFAFHTEKEIAERYGSLIVNGQGPAGTPGQPAAADAPVVLARTVVKVTPLPATAAPAMTFFDGFDDATDQPAYVADLDNTDRTQGGKLYQNSNWSIYMYGEAAAQAFVDRGQLHLVLADWSQDIMSSLIASPKQPVQVAADTYLHVTFEVASDATSRRYWWLSLCGAGAKGQTVDSNGRVMGSIIQTPFFYQPDGRNPSVQGWNCFQLFPRDGWPFALAPTGTQPESDLRVMVNKADATPGTRDSVLNVSPDQFNDPAIAAPSWFRQQKGSVLQAPMLDDQLLIAPRTKYDLYLRRGRAVLYVNGQQRLCNDFPHQALTMAEGALGFGQVLYHSAAERQEFHASYWDRTGQLHYLENTPFVDERTWDNLGYDEGVAAPPSFDDSSCYVAP